jgi:hypothetical protein
MADIKENEELHAQTKSEETTEPSANPVDRHDAPSRRELIQRYGKYAVAAAPLLLFVSKAHAIHSKP